jgi:hypothetical protein
MSDFSQALLARRLPQKSSTGWCAPSDYQLTQEALAALTDVGFSPVTTDSVRSLQSLLVSWVWGQLSLWRRFSLCFFGEGLRWTRVPRELYPGIVLRIYNTQREHSLELLSSLVWSVEYLSDGDHVYAAFELVQTGSADGPIYVQGWLTDPQESGLKGYDYTPFRPCS